MPEQPSQTRYPWRATARTVFQAAVGIAAGLPFIIAASDVPATTAGVGTALAVAAAVTRLMADPVVNSLLPAWLKAEPKEF